MNPLIRECVEKYGGNSKKWKTKFNKSIKNYEERKKGGELIDPTTFMREWFGEKINVRIFFRFIEENSNPYTGYYIGDIFVFKDVENSPYFITGDTSELIFLLNMNTGYIHGKSRGHSVSRVDVYKEQLEFREGSIKKDIWEEITGERRGRKIFERVTDKRILRKFGK